MTVAFQRMFRILERWNNNQVTPSLSKPHELSYRSNTRTAKIMTEIKYEKLKICITCSERILHVLVALLKPINR